MTETSNINQIKIGQNFMGLFKGFNGSGKTIAAASFPEPLHIFDFDGRVAPLRLFYAKEFQRKELSYATYGPHNVWEMLDKLDGLCDYNPYKTIIIDSLTSLSVSIVTWRLRNRRIDPKEIKERLNSNAKERNLQLPDWDEYKAEAVFITQVLDLCKVISSQGGNIIWTAHPVPKTRIEGSGRGMKVSHVNEIMAYGTKAAGIVPGYFNEIYQFGIEESTNFGEPSKRMAWTETIGDDFAKTALPIPKEIDWTGRRDFYSLIQSYVDAYNKEEKEWYRDNPEVSEESKRSEVNEVK